MSEQKPYTLQDFSDFIDKHEVALRAARLKQADNPELYVFARLAKLTEEAGELANAVLHHYHSQRPGKQFVGSKAEIADKLADIWIVTAVIARHFGINMSAALQTKTGKMTARRQAGDL